ncbi:MAG: enoyl-CoA hydratase/isomerase family protein [Desulfurococcales archaeon]|nr:enoyl-CoA hydratase/isomerase family protein [Desulfurococcales archaeon]
MPIRVEHLDKASLIIIDREEKGNSLDYRHAVELARIIREECENPETVAIVITGSGERFFSTGVDLESVAEITSIDDSIKLMGEGLGGVCKAVSSCKKPVIAAVNGHAVGIGFELVLASDLAYSVRGAKLGSPAVKWGMVPPASTTLGPLILGYKNAAYIVLSGRLMTAEEAFRMGVLNGVVDDREELLNTIKKLVEDIASNSQWAVENALTLLRSSRPYPLVEAGLRSLITSAAREETRNRARSFIEKKKK